MWLKNKLFKEVFKVSSAAKQVGSGHTKWTHAQLSFRYRERNCAENYIINNTIDFLNCSQHFGSFKP